MNAGEGCTAHPTQALLDLYTLQRHFGEVKGLTVAMIGDLRHSRVVRSNLWSLKTFGARVILSGPESMRASGPGGTGPVSSRWRKRSGRRMR